MLSFKSIFNDFYLMDLSKKIKSSQRTMALEGKRVAGRPPYGYRADPADKHKFIIDEYAAGIVRRIFEMRLKGFGYSKIAGALNSENILSPREYAYHFGGKEYPYKIRSVWLSKAVKDVTRSEAYLGHRVQLRHSVISYKIHKMVTNPKDEWVRAENVHTPIIDRAIWEDVQEVNANAKASYNGKGPTPALFGGILRCAGCGGAFNIAKTTIKYPSGVVWSAKYYRCARYALSGGSCCESHSISEDALTRILLDDIQKHCGMIASDKDMVIATLKGETGAASDKADTEKELARLERRIGELDRKVAMLYEDKVTGVVSGDAFSVLLAQCESEREGILRRQANLAHDRKSTDARTENILDWMDLVARHSEVERIDRELLTELVERIEVGKSQAENGLKRQDVRIFYKFVGMAL
jgi:hypothetical protein